MFSNKLTELYHSMKNSFGKIDFQDATEQYHSMKKLDFQDATTRVVGPFGIFVGAYTVMSNASNDMLEIAKDQQTHVKEIRKLLDPAGFGQVEEVPEQTRVRRAFSWLQEQKKNAGSRAIH